MAIVTCPECWHKMSDKAAACPNCGHPNIKPEAAKNEAREPDGAVNESGASGNELIDSQAFKQQPETSTHPTEKCEPENSERLRRSKKKKIIVAVLILSFIALGITDIKDAHDRRTMQQAFDLVSELTDKAESSGLKNVKVLVSCQKNNTFQATIKCSNLEDFSYDEMLKIGEDVDVSNASEDFYSNGNTYQISPDKGITKNGKDIYRDEPLGK